MQHKFSCCSERIPHDSEHTGTALTKWKALQSELILEISISFGKCGKVLNKPIFIENMMVPRIWALMY